MPLRNCTKEGCVRPAERDTGSCMLCAQHLCTTHLRPSSHTCPTRETDPDAYFAAYDAAKKKYLAALLAKVDVAALQAVASKARDGVPCTIPALSGNLDADARLVMVAGQCGGQNCHVDVVFADGVTWLARLRLDDPLLPPAAVQERVFLSEVATLQFLSTTAVPAPRVYGYAPASAPGNSVGTMYVLMEKLHGQPLDWNEATPQQREHVLQQLVDVYLELEAHPLPMSGSLSLDDGGGGGVHVGSFAQLPCFETPGSAIGPFQTEHEFLSALVRRQMKMLTSGEIGVLPVDNYLTFLWRLQALPDLVGPGDKADGGPFYLKHYDDKGDHILVDAAFNITGIIDWEWASAEAKPYAFSSPCMMWPVSDFYDGSNTLAPEESRFANLFAERGRSDLAEAVRGGRQWQRYLFFGGGMPRDMAELEALFQGLRKAFAGADEEVSPYADWKASVLAKFAAKDSQLAALLREEVV